MVEEELDEGLDQAYQQLGPTIFHDRKTGLEMEAPGTESKSKLLEK